MVQNNLEDRKRRDFRTQGMIVGFVVGMLLSSPLLFLNHNQIVDRILDISIFVFLIIIVLIALLVTITFCREKIISIIFNGAKGDISNAVKNVESIALAVINRDIQAVSSHASIITNEIVGWYSLQAVRRLLISTALALLLAFAGTVGTLLLYQQNKLLSNQIDIEQTKLLDNLIEKHDLVIESKEISLDSLKADKQCLKRFAGVKEPYTENCVTEHRRLIQYLNFHERIAGKIQNNTLRRDDAINEFSLYWRDIFRNDFGRDIITITRLIQPGMYQSLIDLTIESVPNASCVSTDIKTTDDFFTKYAIEKINNKK